MDYDALWDDAPCENSPVKNDGDIDLGVDAELLRLMPSAFDPCYVDNTRTESESCITPAANAAVHCVRSATSVATVGSHEHGSRMRAYDSTPDIDCVSNSRDHTPHGYMFHEATNSTADTCSDPVQTDGEMCQSSLTVERGVLSFPPLSGGISFMMRSDTGLVRWVTTAASPSPHPARRRRCPHRRQGARGGGGLVRNGQSVHRLHHDNDHSLGSMCAKYEEDIYDDDADADEGWHEEECAACSAMRGGGDADGRAASPAPRGLHLLHGTTLTALMQQVYSEMAEDRLKRIDCPSTRVINHTNRDGATGSNVHDNTLRSSCSNTMGNSSRGGALWVEKYTPRSFREVLSDDTMSLQLLRWLKSWDDYVFHRGRQSSHRGTHGDDAHLSATPPAVRLAVLAGPPGVGKTTLVHVLARHCGYEVIEVNASMERTVSGLEAMIKMAATPNAVPIPSSTANTNHTIEHDGSSNFATPSSRRTHDAMESLGSVATSEKSVSLVHHLRRPKCLVIDEMDGITGNVATLLLQQPLLRPVFCLCNDLYAPALRAVRQGCDNIYKLPPIPPQRLLSRLDEILRREGVRDRVEQTALVELVQASNGDIRSCLNTLQFYSSMTSSAPSSLREFVGKDPQHDVWNTWSMLFRRQDRGQAIQRLRQECCVDYDALIVASVAALRHNSKASINANDDGSSNHNNNNNSNNNNTSSNSNNDNSNTGSRHHTYDTLDEKNMTTPMSHRDMCQRGQHTGTLNVRNCSEGVDPAESSRARVNDSTDSRPATIQSCGNAHQTGRTAVAPGFRVDPGYMVVAHALRFAQSDDFSALLLDGVHENYLDQPYLDYRFDKTRRMAQSLAHHNVVLARTITGAAAMTSLIPFAERYAREVTALTSYVCCSTATRRPRLRYPREMSQLSALVASSANVVRDWVESVAQHGLVQSSSRQRAHTRARSGSIRTSPPSSIAVGDGNHDNDSSSDAHAAKEDRERRVTNGLVGVAADDCSLRGGAVGAELVAHMCTREAVGRDVAPFLSCCLVDSALHMPAHAASFAMHAAKIDCDQASIGGRGGYCGSASRCGTTDVRGQMISAAVQRHAAYGLTYAHTRDVVCAHLWFTAPAERMPKGVSSHAEPAWNRASAMDETDSAEGGGESVMWRLRPALDELARCLQWAPRRQTTESATHTKEHQMSLTSSSPAKVSPWVAIQSACTPELRTLLVGELQRFVLVERSMMTQARHVQQQQCALQRRRDALTETSQANSRVSDGRSDAAPKDTRGLSLVHRLKRSRGGNDGKNASVLSINPKSKEDDMTVFSPDAKPSTTEVDATAAHPNVVSHATALDAAKSNMASNISAAMSSTTPVVRDFFGRIVTKSEPVVQRRVGSLTAARPADTMTMATKLSTSGRARSPAPGSACAVACNVRYVYHDGATNAVKMDATWSDFA